MSSIPDNDFETQPLPALRELQWYFQWVCYIFVSRGKRISKPPINPKRAEYPANKERLADINNSATWATYEEALTTWKASRSYKGIGFVFTATDPFCGIDLDHCIDPTTGKIASWAVSILNLLNSYSELSATGTGIHIYIKARLDSTLKALTLQEIKHKKGEVEIYDQERYFTWSGKHLEGTPETIEGRQDQLDWLYFELFCVEDEEEEKTEQMTQPPLPSQTLLPDDATLISLAESAHGHNGRLFSQLWRGDLSGYRKSNSNEPDYSRADLALCSILAYWTQRDPLRIDRLFRQSALYEPKDRKEKWDRSARSGESYGEGTIRIAITRCYKVYDPSWRPVEYQEYRKNLSNQSFPQEERGAHV